MRAAGRLSRQTAKEKIRYLAGDNVNDEFFVVDNVSVSVAPEGVIKGAGYAETS